MQSVSAHKQNSYIPHSNCMLSICLNVIFFPSFFLGRPRKWKLKLSVVAIIACAIYSALLGCHLEGSPGEFRLYWALLIGLCDCWFHISAEYSAISQCLCEAISRVICRHVHTAEVRLRVPTREDSSMQAVLHVHTDNDGIPGQKVLVPSAVDRVVPAIACTKGCQGDRDQAG